uniref:Serpentine receptor class gamma n=1 Tax=Parastrongyloides trichosuri TaxID=131310 RepID=A0A0N4ZI60_PARTI
MFLDYFNLYYVSGLVIARYCLICTEKKLTRWRSVLIIFSCFILSSVLGIYSQFSTNHLVTYNSISISIKGQNVTFNDLEGSSIGFSVCTVSLKIFLI